MNKSISFKQNKLRKLNIGMHVAIKIFQKLE